MTDQFLFTLIVSKVFHKQYYYLPGHSKLPLQFFRPGRVNIIVDFIDGGKEGGDQKEQRGPAPR